MGEPESERHGTGTPAGWAISNGFDNEYHLAPGGIDRGLQAHPGIDIIRPDGMSFGAAVYAIADGMVEWAGTAAGSWGRVILISHAKPMFSQYAHLASIDVSHGERVKRGQRIGLVGNADGRFAAHLHFELRKVALLPDSWPATSGRNLAAQHAFVRGNYVQPIGLLGL